MSCLSWPREVSVGLNPSIERPLAGKPSPAAHVKRQALVPRLCTLRQVQRARASERRDVGVQNVGGAMASSARNVTVDADGTDASSPLIGKDCAARDSSEMADNLAVVAAPRANEPRTSVESRMARRAAMCIRNSGVDKSSSIDMMYVAGTCAASASDSFVSNVLLAVGRMAMAPRSPLVGLP